MKWIQSIFALYISALITFLVGVPLGNEGPSVQMGAAVGKGNSRLLKKNRLAWERYFMTGGACAGFAIVTGAPLSGIMFALEEAHRRFSVALFSVASFSVLFGTVTYRYLAFFFHTDIKFLDLTISETLPMKYPAILRDVSAPASPPAAAQEQCMQRSRKIILFQPARILTVSATSRNSFAMCLTSNTDLQRQIPIINKK